MTLIDSGLDNGDIDRLVKAIGREPHAKPPLTDEIVDRAAQAYINSPGGSLLGGIRAALESSGAFAEPEPPESLADAARAAAHHLRNLPGTDEGSDQVMWERLEAALAREERA